STNTTPSERSKIRSISPARPRQRSAGVVFVEVKKAKSVETALQRLTARQMQRLFCAGEEYLGSLPGGLLTPARFDLAAVGGLGDISIVENISA
ncbi:MAG: YraN family protein, partial [Pseudomonadota bacterium]